MIENKKYKIILFCTVLISLMLFAETAYADMGPKPTLTIRLNNLRDEPCYATLLSDTAYRSFPNVYNPDTDTAEKILVDRKFKEYNDVDGYSYFSYYCKIDESNEMIWGYMPPNKFKLLLYFPESDTYAISNICERYQFDSYFSVDMAKINSEYSDSTIELEKTIDMKKRDSNGNKHRVSTIELEKTNAVIFNAKPFFERIIITIILELLAALLFGFRKKKDFAIIALVNIITQIILNFLIYTSCYHFGLDALPLYYMVFETIIFVIEAILYCTVLKKVSERPKKNIIYILYAFVANFLSFALGIIMTV